MGSVNSADPACRVIHRFQYFSIVNAITEFYRSACVSEIASVYSCVSCLNAKWNLPSPIPSLRKEKKQKKNDASMVGNSQ